MIAVCLKEQGECQSASAQLELLLKDPKCQGAKAQAIRYELGLLYETQEQWGQAAAIYESIPTFHDVPQRLESARARRAPAEPTPMFLYETSRTLKQAACLSPIFDVPTGDHFLAAPQTVPSSRAVAVGPSAIPLVRCGLRQTCLGQGAVSGAPGLGG